MMKKYSWLLLVVSALLIQGCGGSGGGGGSASTGGTAPTAKTQSNIALHVSNAGQGLLGDSFLSFGAGSAASNTPHFDKLLGLWVVNALTLTSYTRTFYQDQAEKEPAGSAVYTLDISTETLSGTISITAGNYAGLSGNYTATKSGNSVNGNYAFTLPNGASVRSAFTVTVSGGTVTGSGTRTVTTASGYVETSTIVRNADGTMKITASDSNGYQSTLNFAADNSGTGTVTGPDPGLPTTLKWDSTGTGTITFANGSVVNFTNWQFKTT